MPDNPIGLVKDTFRHLVTKNQQPLNLRKKILAIFIVLGTSIVRLLYFGVLVIYLKWPRLSFQLKASRFESLVLTFDDRPGTGKRMCTMSEFVGNAGQDNWTYQ